MQRINFAIVTIWMLTLTSFSIMMSQQGYILKLSQILIVCGICSVWITFGAWMLWGLTTQLRFTPRHRLDHPLKEFLYILISWWVILAPFQLLPESKGMSGGWMIQIHLFLTIATALCAVWKRERCLDCPEYKHCPDRALYEAMKERRPISILLPFFYIIQLSPRADTEKP